MIMAQSTAPTHTQGGESVRGQSQLSAVAKRIAGDVNVGQSERVISSVAGGALALAGIRMRSVPGALVAAVGGAMLFRGVTGHCPAYQSLGVNTAGDRHGAAASPEDYYTRGIHVEQALTIERTPWDLYEFWRNFTNLPQFMEHLESVTVIDDKRSHWVAKAPSIAGGKVEWDAEIINDEPNALIAWRSLENANVDNAGSVRFVPGPEGRGTEVRVVIDYIPPGGRFGSWVAKLFGEEPSQQIREDLRRFKRLMETGEIPTTQGQPRGDCSGGGKRHSGY
jgi:uncharacterized membrane protein